MADFRLSLAARRAAGDALAALADAGGGPGHVRLYAGAKPLGPDAALSGNTLLADIVLPVPAFAPTDAEGKMIANAVPNDPVAVASGTAGFFRLEDMAGVAVFQGDVTVTGGGGDLELATLAIEAGVLVSLSDLTVTVPEV